MEPFKNFYNPKTIAEMGGEIEKYAPTSFCSKTFAKEASRGLKKLEMKERVVQIAETLHRHLPGPYQKNISILLKTLANEKTEKGLSGFILWPYSYYIETYGKKEVSMSLKALYELTKRFTSEWGVRPFLENHSEEVYQKFEVWVRDKNEHIRRWVSEGTRPNLPWGQKISHMESLFERNLRLLECLKGDSSEYVRKSVANHLNDISWHRPELVIKTLKRWNKTKTPEMQTLIYRALRSLLKHGHPQALSLLGYNPKAKVRVKDLKLSKKRVREGDEFTLSLSIQNLEKITNPLMVDYEILYPKANGKMSPKVFKMKKLTLGSKSTEEVTKKVSFKKVTTRTHYLGQHSVTVLVNGQRLGEAHFTLIK